MQVMQQSLFDWHTKYETFLFALPAATLFTQENESTA